MVVQLSGMHTVKVPSELAQRMTITSAYFGMTPQAFVLRLFTMLVDEAADISPTLAGIFGEPMRKSDMRQDDDESMQHD